MLSLPEGIGPSVKYAIKHIDQNYQDKTYLSNILMGSRNIKHLILHIDQSQVVLDSFIYIRPQYVLYMFTYSYGNFGTLSLQMFNLNIHFHYKQILFHICSYLLLYWHKLRSLSVFLFCNIIALWHITNIYKYYMHVCVCVFACVCVCVCVRMHACVCVYKYKSTRIPVQYTEY